MSIVISKRLSNSLEGALAGGGDPATSPLYVFGPFLKLIVIAGVAQVTFGASVWMAVFSVIVVSAMYRQVMRWVSDGSGGSGLSEEEFGSWAVKITAGITVVEYVLTYLVSMAALVTFIADRFSLLNMQFHGVPYRAILAVALCLFSCWIVNLGPKISARAFGPATAAVLLLLWGMVIAAIFKTGFQLPDFNFQAFSLAEVNYTAGDGAQVTTSYLSLTFGGYARILALMTGIEIFANLVAAYDGTPAERGKKAFGSLMIIMGTTVATMLIVGPAILAHSDPMNEHVSVFTQTMDFLFPPWLSYAGTMIGVVVLLSACAAAAQAIQNLALGLRYRHYVPARLGQRNKHDVADRPVWIMAAVCSVCFLLFGTKEDTYLALYAAGVFILLSMTGWAASKRLVRELRAELTKSKIMSLAGTVVAATLTTFATMVIFEERFYEGAWSYLVLIPVFYAIFTYYRQYLGPPPSVEDRLGRIVAGQGFTPQDVLRKKSTDPYFKNYDHTSFRKALVTLDGATLSDQLLPLMCFLSVAKGATVELLLINNDRNRTRDDQIAYVQALSDKFAQAGLPANFKIVQGDAGLHIVRRATMTNADLIVATTAGNTATGKVISNNVVEEVIRKTLIPTLIIGAGGNIPGPFEKFNRILVAMDGSEASESVLLYIRTLARGKGSSVTLLFVPEGSESENFRQTIQLYFDRIAMQLKKEGINAAVSITGSGAARTILALAEADKIDLIMMASHGRGGINRSRIHLGSVTEKVMQETPCPMFVVPLTQSDYFS
ncbi:MAG: universal stress protein [Bdellovibrionales bacterium]